MIMKLRFNDFEAYTQNAPSYKDGLIFVQSGIEKKDTNCWVMWLRRLCQKNEGLSFMYITSSHDSKGTIEREVVHTGKAGRPKIIVRGKKAENHCHGLIVNENKETNIEEIKKEVQAYSKKLRKRRPNLRRQKVSNVWSDGLPIVSYMTRQMNERKPYTYGTFDFLYFDDIRYCKYHDADTSDNYDNILEP